MISELLKRGGVWYNLDASTPQEAIRKASEVVCARLYPAVIDKDASELAGAALEREGQSSTAVGEGLAFPHARAPFLRNREAAFMALFYPRFPILWAAPDGLPVRAFFLIASASPAEHLSSLSSLAKRCSNPEFARLLAGKATLDQLLSLLGRVS